MEKFELKASETSFVASLNNEELKASVTNIFIEQASAVKSAWNIAKEYFNIITGETYSDDFDNLNDFAMMMGTTKGDISQKVNAYNFIQNNPEFIGLTVTKAYKLSTLKDEQLNEFKEYCKTSDIDIFSLSDKGLILVLNEWKKGIPQEVATVDAKEVKESTTDSTDTNDIDEGTMVEFEVLGKKYRMPQEVLDRYAI